MLTAYKSIFEVGVMFDARTKKMMNMYIPDILKRNTDSKHPMTQKGNTKSGSEPSIK